MPPRSPADVGPPDVTSPVARRAAAIERLGADQFDLLVVGGGITGCGIARDAALRGLRVALVERDDFASGTSSRSSRLVHGGVRYLEHGHLHLVFEASRERRTLLRIAPHLVRPLRFVWPVYRGARIPGWKLRAGLTLYDALALFRNVAAHRRLTAEGVAAVEPALRREALVGGATYFDAETDDARLTLATALAAAEAGAVVINHAGVVALTQRDDRVAGAEIVDAAGGGLVRVTARVVVNATGPWGDDLRRLEDPRAPATVRGSKGVHLLVPRDRLAANGALTLLSPVDGRVMFVLPAGGFMIVGTTDTPTEEEPDEVRPSSEDVAYLLEAANHFFPAAGLGRGDVVSAWAGIRPLAASAYAGDAGRASREHDIQRGAMGLVSVSGGKLTTYRAIAAEVVDIAERELGRTPGRPTTARAALPGGDLGTSLADLVEWAASEVGARDIGARLARAYGSRWGAVWELARADVALGERIAPGLPYVMAEVAYAVAREMALTVGDVLIRRTHVAFETRDHGRGVAARVAVVMGRALGWDAARAAAELAAYEGEVERVFGG